MKNQQKGARKLAETRHNKTRRKPSPGKGGGLREKRGQGGKEKARHL
ncbi:hypothetical protein ES707_05206 [subsurface metagenome]